MLNFNNFNSLVQVIKHFSSEANCYSFLKHQRWSDGVVRCPYCGSVHIAHRNGAKQEYRCEHCNKSFSVLAGTIFENTKLPISKWMIGMYLISSHKNGISSVQLAKDIEVTQTTAWYMLHRVRTLMKQDEERMLSGNVECDERTIIHNSEGKIQVAYDHNTIVFNEDDKWLEVDGIEILVIAKSSLSIRWFDNLLLCIYWLLLSWC